METYRPHHYSLRQIKGEQFIGYEDPLDVLKDARKFMQSLPGATFLSISNDFDHETETYGGTLVYEHI